MAAASSVANASSSKEKAIKEDGRKREEVGRQREVRDRGKQRNGAAVGDDWKNMCKSHYLNQSERGEMRGGGK